MIPQIKQIQDASFEEKMELVSKGLAYIDDSGTVYLHLNAVDNLGQQVMQNNPLVMVGNYLRLAQTECELAAEPTVYDAAILEEACEAFYKILSHAVIRGLPLYQAFNAFMVRKNAELLAWPEEEPTVPPVDYMNSLKLWQAYVQELQAAKAAQPELALGSAPAAPAANQ